MKKRLRILHVEDNPLDATLIARALEKIGYDVEWARVETEADYEAALETLPAVVIADYSLPNFSGLRALELLKRRHPDIPFILVSGTVGEERAVEAIRLGAEDYLLKDRLVRLPAAVEKAVRDAEERVTQQRTGSGRRVRDLVGNAAESARRPAAAAAGKHARMAEAAAPGRPCPVPRNVA